VTDVSALSNLHTLNMSWWMCLHSATCIY